MTMPDRVELTPKSVLLSMFHHRREVQNGFMAYAAMHNWNVQTTINWMPRCWYGDGIALDNYRGSLSSVENIPVVTTDGRHRGVNVRHVYNNAEASGEMALDYFTAKGYRNLAIMSWEGRWPGSSTTAFCRIAEGDGRNVEEIRLPPSVGPRDFTADVRFVLDALGRLTLPVAMYVNSTYNVGLLYRACDEAGILIPEEIAVLSDTEDPMFCNTMTPSVSSVAGCDWRIGQAMARVLDEIMAGRAVADVPVLIPPDQIIERGSTNMLAVDEPRIAGAVRYMLSNFALPLTVADIALHAGMSESSLRRHFRRELGMLPNDLLRKVRLEEARRLLINTDESLTVIAGKTGYGSNIALSYAFRQVFGVAPGAYRKQRVTSL